MLIETDPIAYDNYAAWSLGAYRWDVDSTFYYWGTNQYITQRALGGKSLDEAQKGLMFAGF